MRHSVPFGRRINARLIDYFVIFPLFQLVFYGVYHNLEHHQQWETSSTQAAAAVFAVYEVMGIWRWGQTIGKRIMKIRVCHYDTVKPPSFLSAVVRWGVLTCTPFEWLGTVISPLKDITGPIAFGGPFIVFASTILAYYVAAKDGRGLHDLTADTIVDTVVLVPAPTPA